jgi:hypothetical protein
MTSRHRLREPIIGIVRWGSSELFFDDRSNSLSVLGRAKSWNVWNYHSSTHMSLVFISKTKDMLDNIVGILVKPRLDFVIIWN